MNDSIIDLERKIFEALVNTSDSELAEIGVTASQKQDIKTMLDSGIDMPRLHKVMTVELDAEALKEMVSHGV